MSIATPALGSPRQIGFVVNDLAKTLEGYQSDAAIQVIELGGSSNYLFHGEPSHCVLKIAVIEAFGREMEFIEVVEGKHPAGDFLAAHGEGVNHLGFFVDDFDATLAQFDQANWTVAIAGEFEAAGGVSGRFVYLDNAAGGPMYEILGLDP